MTLLPHRIVLILFFIGFTACLRTHQETASIRAAFKSFINSLEEQGPQTTYTLAPHNAFLECSTPSEELGLILSIIIRTQEKIDDARETSPDEILELEPSMQKLYYVIIDHLGRELYQSIASKYANDYRAIKTSLETFLAQENTRFRYPLARALLSLARLSMNGEKLSGAIIDREISLFNQQTRLILAELNSCEVSMTQYEINTISAALKQQLRQYAEPWLNNETTKTCIGMLKFAAALSVVCYGGYVVYNDLQPIIYSINDLSKNNGVLYTFLWNLGERTKNLSGNGSNFMHNGASPLNSQDFQAVPSEAGTLDSFVVMPHSTAEKYN